MEGLAGLGKGLDLMRFVRPVEMNAAIPFWTEAWTETLMAFSTLSWTWNLPHSGC